MNWRVCRFLIFGAVLILAGCASGEKEEGPVSNARPEAYAAEGFAIEKSAPYHGEEGNTLQFFHKQCRSRGEPSYFSKTSYMCDDRAL